MANWTQKIIESVTVRVKRDNATIASILYTYISRLTKNPLNLFLRGESGIGKTYNVTQTIQVLQQTENGDVWWLGGLSPTALVHDYGILMCGEEELNLMDKPNKNIIKEELGEKTTKRQIEQEYYQQMKGWRQKLSESYYLVDLTGKLLVFLESPHIETFNKLRPLLSHDKEKISYKFTDKTSRGELRTSHVILKGWPSTIFCTTDDKLVQDLSTRSLTVTPNLSIEKVKSALQLIAQDYAYPKQTNHELTDIHTHIQKLETLEFYVLIPYAEAIQTQVGYFAHRVMRDFNHFLQCIVINTLLNFDSRPRIEIDNKTFLISTFEDFRQVWTYWCDIEKTTLTGISGNALRLFREIIVPLSKEIESLTYPTIVNKTRDLYPTPLATNTLRRYVNALADTGLVDAETDPSDKRRRLIRVIGEEKKMLICVLSQFPTFFTPETLKEWEKNLTKIDAIQPFLHNIIFENKELTSEELYEKCFTLQQDMLFLFEPQQNEVKNAEQPEKTSKIANTRKLMQFSHPILEYSGTTEHCSNCNVEIPYGVGCYRIEKGVLCATCARAKELGETEDG